MVGQLKKKHLVFVRKMSTRLGFIISFSPTFPSTTKDEDEDGNHGNARLRSGRETACAKLSQERWAALGNSQFLYVKMLKKLTTYETKYNPDKNTNNFEILHEEIARRVELLCVSYTF